MTTGYQRYLNDLMEASASCGGIEFPDLNDPKYQDEPDRSIMKDLIHRLRNGYGYDCRETRLAAADRIEELEAVLHNAIALLEDDQIEKGSERMRQEIRELNEVLGA